MAGRDSKFQTVRSEGGLLPSDLLHRVLVPDGELSGTRSEDYGLLQGDRINEFIARSWTKLQNQWGVFRKAESRLANVETGTGLTNDKWSLPLLKELGFGPLPTITRSQIDRPVFAIKRFFGPVPVHLVGCRVDLDRRTAGARGAARSNPHGMVQDFLNRSNDHLWAIVSNGFRLRVLRDNFALSRQSYLEFDLEAMFEGEAYPDFTLIWMLIHASRFIPPEGKQPEKCLLEKWTREAQKQGTRALGDLSVGVKRALQILGRGFTSHTKNTKLRENLRSGQLTPEELLRQLLRIVFRLIFLFVAENRALGGKPLLHPQNDTKEAGKAREHYVRYYSVTRLKNLAGEIKGSRHGDLWRQFNILIAALSGDSAKEEVRTQLALPALGSFLWDPSSTKELNESEIANYDFLEALRNLAFIRKGKVLRHVDYKNLGADELGGVYENLLELTPQISDDGEQFSFADFAGSERKTSGSYYTPEQLVQCLLDTALDPVVEAATKGKKGGDAEKAILDLTVCDPAVGSGHFLIGAARRLASHLAKVRALREGNSAPSPLLYQQALRDVIGRCVYGVDINQMAAELCRVGLWMEAMEPGKPLSFLDHHIRVGNSLIGAKPDLIMSGFPDEAFKPIKGDEKKACSELKKRNREQRGEIKEPLCEKLLFEEEEGKRLAKLRKLACMYEEIPNDSHENIHRKTQTFREFEQSEDYRLSNLLSNYWSAAFVIKKRFQKNGGKVFAIGITYEDLINLANHWEMNNTIANEVQHLAIQYQFLHWHLAFPHVFHKGGFDCIIGNPPWERVKIQEKEWFAKRNEEIANASNAAARKPMIEELESSDPELYNKYQDDLRKAAGYSHFMRSSGTFPLCARGDINLYAVFAERMRRLLNEKGRIGCVLPTGIATDYTTKKYFQNIVKTNSLISLYDFENRLPLFPEVHKSFKFCLFTVSKGSRPKEKRADFVFFAYSVDDLKDPERRINLDSRDIRLLNPNTRTCPIFRTNKDAELTKAIYRRVPVLICDASGEENPELNPWGVKFNTMFHMSNDSNKFKERKYFAESSWNLQGNKFINVNTLYLPLYEAKMVHQYDHRYSSYMNDKCLSCDHQKQNPCALPMPWYWVCSEEVNKRWASNFDQWTLVFRDITDVTNERTAIFSVLPKVGIGHTAPLLLLDERLKELTLCLYGSLSSFVFDYIARQSVGGNHLTYFTLKQIPTILPQNYMADCSWIKENLSLRDWLNPRIVELIYTAWDLEHFANDCGWNGPPFRWDDERRFLLRCELDAAYFHLYLPADASGCWEKTEKETQVQLDQLNASFSTPRDAVVHILDTFLIVKKNDEKQFNGDFRTKRVILDIYDSLQKSVHSNQSYKSSLVPPAADLSCRHITK